MIEYFHGREHPQIDLPFKIHRRALPNTTNKLRFDAHCNTTTNQAPQRHKDNSPKRRKLPEKKATQKEKFPRQLNCI